MALLHNIGFCGVFLAEGLHEERILCLARLGAKGEDATFVKMKKSRHKMKRLAVQAATRVVRRVIHLPHQILPVQVEDVVIGLCILLHGSLHLLFGFGTNEMVLNRLSQLCQLLFKGAMLTALQK